MARDIGFLPSSVLHEYDYLLCSFFGHLLKLRMMCLNFILFTFVVICRNMKVKNLGLEF